jgi:hypothetical protein
MNTRSFASRLSQHYRRWRTQPGEAPAGPGDVLRWAVLIWLVLAAAVAVRTLYRPSSHTVFPIFAASAAHWWGDQSLYQLYPPLDTFRYPPVFAVFVTPFHLLGSSMGGITWSWASMAVLFAGLWCYVRDAIPSLWTRQRTAVFLILSAWGALRGLWNAQSNALIVGFLLLGTAALARAAAGTSGAANRRTWWGAALLLAVPVALKLTPLAPVLLLAALWPRQLAWRLIVITAGLFALPFLSRSPVIVWDHYREWIDHLTESGSVRWIGFRDGWTVWIVLRHLLGGESDPLSLCAPMESWGYRLLQLGTAVGVLGWCTWQRNRAERLQLGSRWLAHVTLSMGLAWLMLFGPAVEHATYVFLAPPLLWAILERRAWPLGQIVIWASFLLIMVLGWGAVARLLSPDWPILLIALPAGTSLFALWLLGYAHVCGSGIGKTDRGYNYCPTAIPGIRNAIPRITSKVSVGR